MLQTYTNCARVRRLALALLSVTPGDFNGVIRVEDILDYMKVLPGNEEYFHAHLYEKDKCMCRRTVHGHARLRVILKEMRELDYLRGRHPLVGTNDDFQFLFHCVVIRVSETVTAPNAAKVTLHFVSENFASDAVIPLVLE